MFLLDFLLVVLEKELDFDMYETASCVGSSRVCGSTTRMNPISPPVAYELYPFVEHKATPLQFETNVLFSHGNSVPLPRRQ